MLEYKLLFLFFPSLSYDVNICLTKLGSGNLKYGDLERGVEEFRPPESDRTPVLLTTPRKTHLFQGSPHGPTAYSILRRNCGLLSFFFLYFSYERQKLKSLGTID